MVTQKKKETAETAETETTETVGKESSPPQFKRKAQVTFPVLKKKDGESVFIKILEPIFTGRELKAAKDGKKMQPARIAKVVNLETGEQMHMICNKVLESNLIENFPDDAYVGRSFEIAQHGAKQGRDYKTFSVWELDTE